MFSYYGSKSKVIDLYPPPKYDKIIEPFAGSARYSLKYWDRDIVLVDAYKDVADVWEYLQQSTEQDILNLPTLNRGDDLRGYSLSEPEKKFIGFCINRGSVAPRNIAADFNDFEKDKKRVAANLFKIKHWKIIHGTYLDIINSSATWYIDPPYQYGGEHYVKSSKSIDFTYLADWCKSRLGQVIVCENSKADWLNFIPLANLNGQRHKTTEVIWTNIPTSIGSVQTSMF